jgi:hypothetical protein
MDKKRVNVGGGGGGGGRAEEGAIFISFSSKIARGRRSSGA